MSTNSSRADNLSSLSSARLSATITVLALKDRHIVANYLGDWCYDIILNRGNKDNEGHRYKGYSKIEYPEYFPVFMHTNSGYVFIYEGNKKDEHSQNEWQKKFKDELEENFHGYPIVNVRFDAESGFKNNL